MNFVLSKLLSVICYLLLAFLRFTEKCRFWLFSLQCLTSYPWSYHIFKPNKCIALRLSALYSTIYDNRQDWCSKNRLCNALIHSERQQVGDISITSWRQVEQPIIFLRTFALRFKRESLSHSTFRPHTDVGNSSISHQWIRTESQNLADNDGTKWEEHGNWKGETDDVGMVTARTSIN